MYIIVIVEGTQGTLYNFGRYCGTHTTFGTTTGNAYCELFSFTQNQIQHCFADR
jgi:hypothetical protein